MRIFIKNADEKNYFVWAPKEAVAAFVARFFVRSVREYQSVVKSMHEQGEFLDIPINASRVYGMSWNKILYSDSKYIPYLSALNALSLLGVKTKVEFEQIPLEERRKHRLPKKMSVYNEFPGWQKLRNKKRISIEKLAQYCLLKNIKSIAEYSLIAKSIDGRALNFPINPRYAYGAKWKGWSSILAPIFEQMTLEDRAKLMQKRSESRKIKKATIVERAS